MNKSILLDTNLLVLMIVGLTDKKEIEKHKRTTQYTIYDFEILMQYIGSYNKIWVTSHIIAECSNLIRQTNKKMAKLLMITLSNLITKKQTTESKINAIEIFKEPCVYDFGITDCGIFKKAKRVTNILTVDLDLYLKVNKKYNNAINFNHLRKYFIE